MDGEDYRVIDSAIGAFGTVRTFVDDFTDAYSGTTMLVDSRSKDWERYAAVRVYHFDDGWFALQLYDTEREHDIPEDGAKVEVIFRIDDHEAVTLPAYWSGRTSNATAEMGALLLGVFMNDIARAEEIIYRVGEDGDVLRVRVPPEMADLVTEFRRRIDASGVVVSGTWGKAVEAP